MKLCTIEYDNTAATIALAIWQGDESSFIFLFVTYQRFRQRGLRIPLHATSPML